MKTLIVNESNGKSIFSDVFTFGCLFGGFFINYHFLGSSVVVAITISFMVVVGLLHKAMSSTKEMTPEKALEYLTERKMVREGATEDQIQKRGEGIPPYEETHQQGYLSIEQALPARMKECDFGIQIAEDGRVWICIDGISFLRFKPKIENWKHGAKWKD